jgi:hypothetical protein
MPGAHRETGAGVGNGRLTKGVQAMPTDEECRCYAEHLLAEHRHLHQGLWQTRNAVLGADAFGHKASGLDIARLLRRVRAELEHHFREEETGGCLEEAVSRCPALAEEARRIEAEHPRLLEGVDRLIAQALDCDAALEKRIDFERHFDELCGQLHAHEAAENQLLSRGFGVNLNGLQEELSPSTARRTP